MARHFSLIDGWSTSYPETTGYIIPTLLSCADCGTTTRCGSALRRRMLDWLVSIQFPEGGFQGGLIDSTPVVPVTFNTGQILLGFVEGVREFGEPYRGPMRRAADWLVATQDSDGCWRRYRDPVRGARREVLRDPRILGPPRGRSCRAQDFLRPGGTGQCRVGPRQPARPNGWFAKCCLQDESAPLTHTLGYVLRGILEAHAFAGDEELLRSARRAADGLLRALRDDGALPGRLDADWRGTVPWICLTGNVQVAHCWLMLYEETGDERYREAGCAANRFVRRTVAVEGPLPTRGAVKGSMPIDGEYGAYQYLNWACKFFIDSHLLELRVRDASRDHA